MVQSPQTTLHPKAIVSELMDRDTRWWNKTLLENLFSKEEVHLKQSLSVSVSNREDRCIWSGTKNGNFILFYFYYYYYFFS